MESTCPNPLPLTNIVIDKALNPCEINRELLLPAADIVLEKYSNLITSGHSEGNIRMLAVKLAKEAIFGEEEKVHSKGLSHHEIKQQDHSEFH